MRHRNAKMFASLIFLYLLLCPCFTKQLVSRIEGYRSKYQPRALKLISLKLNIPLNSLNQFYIPIQTIEAEAEAEADSVCHIFHI